MIERSIMFATIDHNHRWSLSSEQSSQLSSFVNCILAGYSTERGSNRLWGKPKHGNDHRTVHGDGSPVDLNSSFL